MAKERDPREQGAPEFTELIDLASARLGGVVLGANDEFFAPKENLLKPERAIWLEDEYTDRGKWMDGWETRRRRVPGHDHCVIKLGLAGIVHGVTVDTAFFRGNYPAECSIEGTIAPDSARYEQLESESTVWTPLLKRSPLKGDSLNWFDVDASTRVTHLRFHIYPDGGVARLRVHGDVLPRWDLISRALELDLAAVENGGRAVAASDMFFGGRDNLIMPGRGVNMGDGWETKRRRGPGHDWCVIELGTTGTIRRIEVDTNHFKGNYPDSCSIEGCLAPDATPDQIARRTRGWREILHRVPLQAHTRHFYVAEVADTGPVSHVRLNIYPDGGVSRLRLHGAPSDEGRVRIGLRHLNTLSDAEATAELLRCCGSKRWAREMNLLRPFTSVEALHEAADDVDENMERDDWLEAFAAHPRIGDRRALEEKAKGWESGEQSGASGATDAVIDGLMEGNKKYEDRFGYIFIVNATGKTAAEMLKLLKQRLKNAPDLELDVAATEQRQITKIRLEKLVGARPA